MRRRRKSRLRPAVAVVRVAVVARKGLPFPPIALASSVPAPRSAKVRRILRSSRKTSSAALRSRSVRRGLQISRRPALRLVLGSAPRAFPIRGIPSSVATSPTARLHRIVPPQASTANRAVAAIRPKAERLVKTISLQGCRMISCGSLFVRIRCASPTEAACLRRLRQGDMREGLHDA